jgi:hypothetical protein
VGLYTSFQSVVTSVQKYGALLVDQYGAYEALELALDGIELFNREFLLGFLRGCTCSSTNDNLCQTIEDFLNTECIEWNGLRFTDLENEIPPSQILILL